MKTSANKNLSGIILVPVDYSSYSIQACRYAAKIAKRSGSKICLFHAFYSPAFDLIELTGGLHTQQQLRADVSQKLMEDELGDMSKFVNELLVYKEFSGLKKSDLLTEIKAGLAKDEIVSFTAKSRPNMVVMGTRGVDKKNTSILGSITETAIKKLNVPVLAIPEEYKFLGEENLQKIVYLTDYDESDFVSIKKLLRFSDLFDMAIHCIHIGTSKDKWNVLKMQGLKDYFRKAYQKDSVECHIIDSKHDLLQAIDTYVTSNNINLIALTHKKRKLLDKVLKPSITRKIFYHAEIPLLVFHS